MSGAAARPKHATCERHTETGVAVPRPPLVWEREPHLLPQLLESSPQLPVVVQCAPSSVLDVFNFNIHQPFLLYRKRSVRKVKARSMQYDRKTGSYQEVGDILLIPEDYVGWLAIIGRAVQTEEKVVPHYRKVSNLATSPCRKFLVGGTKPVSALQVDNLGSPNAQIRSRSLMPGDVFRKGANYTGISTVKTKGRWGKERVTREEMYVMCYDVNDREVLIPTETEGMFYVIEQEGIPLRMPILQMSDIITRYKFPCMVQLLYGRKPITPCSFTGTLMLTEAAMESTVVAATMLNFNNINMEIPLTSDVMYYKAKDSPELRQSVAFKRSLRLCQDKAAQYMRCIKVILTLKEDKRTSRDSANSTSTCDSSDGSSQDSNADQPRGASLSRSDSRGSIDSSMIVSIETDQEVFSPSPITPTVLFPVKSKGSKKSASTNDLSKKITSPVLFRKNAYFSLPETPEQLPIHPGRPGLARNKSCSNARADPQYETIKEKSSTLMPTTSAESGACHTGTDAPQPSPYDAAWRGEDDDDVVESSNEKAVVENSESSLSSKSRVGNGYLTMPIFRSKSEPAPPNGDGEEKKATGDYEQMVHPGTLKTDTGRSISTKSRKIPPLPQEPSGHYTAPRVTPSKPPPPPQTQPPPRVQPPPPALHLKMPPPPLSTPDPKSSPPAPSTPHLKTPPTPSSTPHLKSPPPPPPQQAKPKSLSASVRLNNARTGRPEAAPPTSPNSGGHGTVTYVNIALPKPMTTNESDASPYDEVLEESFYPADSDSSVPSMETLSKYDKLDSVVYNTPRYRSLNSPSDNGKTGMDNYSGYEVAESVFVRANARIAQQPTLEEYEEESEYVPSSDHHYDAVDECFQATADPTQTPTNNSASSTSDPNRDILAQLQLVCKKRREKLDQLASENHSHKSTEPKSDVNDKTPLSSAVESPPPKSPVSPNAYSPTPSATLPRPSESKAAPLLAPKPAKKPPSPLPKGTGTNLASSQSISLKDIAFSSSKQTAYVKGNASKLSTQTAFVKNNSANFSQNSNTLTPKTDAIKHSSREENFNADNIPNREHVRRIHVMPTQERCADVVISDRTCPEDADALDNLSTCSDDTLPLGATFTTVNKAQYRDSGCQLSTADSCDVTSEPSIASLSVVKLGEALKEIGLHEDTLAALREQKVDGRLLQSLDQDALREALPMGVKGIDIRKLCMFVQGWRPLT